MSTRWKQPPGISVDVDCVECGSVSLGLKVDLRGDLNNSGAPRSVQGYLVRNYSRPGASANGGEPISKKSMKKGSMCSFIVKTAVSVRLLILIIF